MTELWVPPYPERQPKPVPTWRGFLGERGRTAVVGWSQRAFEADYFKRNVFGHTVHIVLKPEWVQRVLLDNSANYEKPGLVKRILSRTIGRGLLTAEGELWRTQRKIVAGSFTPPAVDALVPLFGEVGTALGSSWAEGTRDMAAEATSATMRVIATALFSGDERLTTPEAMDHITAAMEGVVEARIQVLLGMPLIPLTPRGRRGRAGQQFLRRTLGAIVEERLRPDAPDDFVTAMVRELIGRFPREEAVELATDNAATFYLAGHETTANLTSWTLFVLSEQQKLQDRVAGEASAALDAGVDAALPQRLPLLRAVIDETLRLYPPVPRFDREAIGDDMLGPHEVKPGDLVSIWPWLIHRNRRLWSDPDAFDPSRFEGAKDGRHRFQYLPFGAGPRTCVGARFAMAEALAILALWLREWRFEPLPGRNVRPSGMVTLRQEGGLPLVLSRRSPRTYS